MLKSRFLRFTSTLFTKTVSYQIFTFAFFPVKTKPINRMESSMKTSMKTSVKTSMKTSMKARMKTSMKTSITASIKASMKANDVIRGHA